MNIKAKTALISTQLAMVGTMVAATTQTAFAQFVPPASQGFGDLIGDNTAGSETGVYELAPLIVGAGAAIVLLTIIMVGIVFARKVIRKFTG